MQIMAFYGASGIFYTLALLYIISVVILLLLENRDPERTIAWLLIFLLFPLIGLIIYFYSGQNWKKKNFIKNFQTKELNLFLQKEDRCFQANDCKASTLSDKLQEKLAKNIEKSINFSPTAKNSFKLLTTGQEKYDWLKKELKKAKKFIHMEYYIIKSDKISNEIKDILIQKAKEGVEVRLLFDYMGCLQFSKKMRRELKCAGVMIQDFFNPLKLFAYHKLNYRNHRKITVIDGQVGFVGGMNIGDYYITGRHRFSHWQDLHSKVEGGVVGQIEAVFLYDWYLATKKSIITESYFPKSKSKGTKEMQILYSGPESKWAVVKHAFLTMITNAEKNITIITPYFVPDKVLFTALKNAALSGVKVKIILPHRSEKRFDFRVAFFAGKTYYDELLEAGAEIHEYKKGFIHAKTIVVDAKTALIGTANFDVRSMEVNFEINLALYNKSDAEEISNYAAKILEDCQKVKIEEFRKRSKLTMLAESVARLLSPIL
jgi:cardiolipin synthase A/B